MIKQYDRVVLVDNVPKAHLVKGDVGTVIEIYNNGEGFEIEFFALDGTTISVETLLKHQVRTVNKKEILHTRAYA